MADYCTDDAAARAAKALQDGDYSVAGDTIANCASSAWTGKEQKIFLQKVGTDAGASGKLGLQIEYYPVGSLKSYRIQPNSVTDK